MNKSRLEKKYVGYLSAGNGRHDAAAIQMADVHDGPL